MTSSLDTNILVYAADEDAAEHAAASVVVEEMLGNPGDWVLADQVLFEFYRALRNPRVFRKPLGAAQAAMRLDFLYRESGVTRCCYGLGDWEKVFAQLADQATPVGRTHDVILAATLISHGVGRFYTRNVKDFRLAGFHDLVNPIDV